MSGFFVQSNLGPRGDFEVVLPGRVAPGLVHYSRTDDGSPRWSGPTRFGGALSPRGISLIQSNYGAPGNLEVIVVADGQLLHFWRDSGPAPAWNGPFTVASGVSGIPGFIQSRFGSKGNFEVVVPAASGGLVHYARDNDDPSMPWSGPTSFGSSLGMIDAVSLIQSNYGSPGNLEVVALANHQVHHLWRDSGPAFAWSAPFPIAGATGYPSLIQSSIGSRGNFELVVQGVSNGLAHFSRNNDDPSASWSGPTSFGSFLQFGVPSLIQSNYGAPGNLEVVAGTFGDSAELAYFWRDSGPSFRWSRILVVETGI